HGRPPATRASSRRNWHGSGARHERRQRLVARLVNAEGAVDPGDLEQAPDLCIGAADLEPAPLALVNDPRARVNDDAQPRGVDEAAVAEVDQERAAAFLDRVLERLAQLGGGGMVELAAKPECTDVPVELFDLNGERSSHGRGQPQAQAAAGS